MSFTLPSAWQQAENPVQVLLGGLIDYAGLFPPAQLSMAEAVRQHAQNLAGPHAPHAGRFVLPVSRLSEFMQEYFQLSYKTTGNWQLSVLASGNPAEDSKAVDDFNICQRHARVVAIETRAATPAEVARATGAFPRTMEVWVEIPAAAGPESLLTAIKQSESGAKIRLGGVTAAAFPAAVDIARFLRSCHDAGVVCKATAGLHHPLRGDYPLTCEPGSPSARMFGFLNIILAAALIRQGGTDAAVIELLEDSEAANFSVLTGELAWRGHRFTPDALAATRRLLCRSFGSCCFTEPIEGLQVLHWL